MITIDGMFCFIFMYMENNISMHNDYEWRQQRAFIKHNNKDEEPCKNDSIVKEDDGVFIVLKHVSKCFVHKDIKKKIVL